MSISDDLMWNYYELLSSKSLSEIETLKKSVAEGSLHPKNVKMDLGVELVARFHSQSEALKAKEEFETVFKKGDLPENIEVSEVQKQGEKMSLASVMTQAQLVSSNSDGKRMIDQGAVKVNEEKITDTNYQVSTSQEILVQVGKRKFKKIVFV